MKNYIKLLALLIPIIFVTSCKQFLDIVPDNVATIDYAFRNRMEAEKYVFTCYSYLPSYASLSGNPGLLGSDELATNYPNAFNFGDIDPTMMAISLGLRNKVNPVADFWVGSNGGKSYFRAIRECNVFFENADNIVDVTLTEKKRWIAEVKFLKAYYHYWLMRMYGPIPIIRNNLPIGASIDQVRVFREPIDDVSNYIVELIDEAIPDLPDVLMNEMTELGRITQAIALSVKAEVLTTVASPLYNGNTDYANFLDHRGIAYFNQTYSEQKWVLARDAVKVAIDKCHEQGHKLYYYRPRLSNFKLSDSTFTQMNIRASITERWNVETIWGGSNSLASGSGSGLQGNSQPYLNPRGANASVKQNLAVNIGFTDLFYSENGVPINEDPMYDYVNRFTKLRTAGTNDRYYIKEGYTTAQCNFDREPRYYASLAFDGSIFYGSGTLDDNNPFWVEAKLGQTAGNGTNTNFSVTGYWPKKLVNFTSTYGSNNNYQGESYPWPIIRLAELYLYYAEANNEVEGPSEESYKYIDSVRTRAGLKGVVESWKNHSRIANKPNTKDGLRDIIRQERSLEIAFEGKRFWDVRRWKTAVDHLNKPILGWQIAKNTTAEYYNISVVNHLIFTIKDYFWPLSENSLMENPNLIQNVGW